MIRIMNRNLSAEARGRLAWMDAYRECGNAALVCRRFSVPLRTFWRWHGRYDPWDLSSLECRRRGPKAPPGRKPREVELAVLALKRDRPRWGKEKIALVLRGRGVAVSGATVWRVLRRHSLSVRYRTRKRRAPRPRADWSAVRLPGDLVQVDTKYVALGRRRLFQYTAVDAVTRWRHAEVHERLDGATAAAFAASVSAAAPFRVALVQTDNGKEFRREFAASLRRLGARHVYSHKASPTENGRVERSHRTDEEEFWSLGPAASGLADLREKFAGYMSMYNNERPHWALGGRTPSEAVASYSSNGPCHNS